MDPSIHATSLHPGHESRINLPQLKRDLDVGAVIILTPITKTLQDEEVKFQTSLIESCQKLDVPVCLWPEASTEDFESETLGDAIEGMHTDNTDGETSKGRREIAVAFALSRFIRDIVGGWSNSFG
eukprot:CAMPEP_0171606026 /NCGR_PEP_ID=MMETSP0990-20121206/7525_1 /TAXON_ID=483369 /ORGANISM="non described non described, Strain CCMP2098" /LENGTH=125 /DNA_ID=CAMNT_0012168799 /DNA_START=259 /DNA_END=636 /DNA_ORIENTATION=+